jgi:hypothetical protein
MVGWVFAHYGSTRAWKIHPMGAPAKPGPRRAQRWSPSLACEASTIGTHGAKQLDSVALGLPEARDEF